MITKKELQDYARIKGLTLGNAEKDYLIDIALRSIFANTKNEMVFKGGTCLYKFHKLTRFSEDIDFSMVAPFDLNKLLDKVLLDFKKFGIYAHQYQRKEQHHSLIITLRIKGPLYSGQPITYASLGIDVNLKSSVLLEPETLLYTSPYPDLPSFHAFCMQKEEIFAEKIRALLTRTRARDLFDLYFLLEAGIHADKHMIQQKMDYYHEHFAVNKLLQKLPDFAPRWNKELVGFTQYLPTYTLVSASVKKSLVKLYKS